jgi:hypothetical protein
MLIPAPVTPPNTLPTSLPMVERSDGTFRKSVHWATSSDAVQQPCAPIPLQNSILRPLGVKCPNFLLRTSPFLLEFKFRGKEHSIAFASITMGIELLPFFEKRIVEAVEYDEKLAIVRALYQGYGLEFGFWGRTIRRPIRGEAVMFPEAAFHTVLNAIRPNQAITIF